MKGKIKQEFSTFDVIKILAIERERLREWLGKGFITPTVPAEGRGTKAIFSLLDVYKIAVFVNLIEAGMNRRKAARWVSTNPTLNSKDDVKELNYIMITQGDFGGRWYSYLGRGPLTIEQDINMDEEMNFGIIINFKKLRGRINNTIQTL